MKLYYKAGACSLSPHIALREAGLPFELEAVDLKTKLTASGKDFTRINGKGYIPALQLDNGKVLTEGAAIVQYIADLKPESGLAPANGSEARYELQSWLSFISSELHKPFGSMFNPAQSADWKAAAQALLSKRLDWLVTELGEREFLLGDRFTVADGYLFTVLGWAGMVGFSLDPWPGLQAYHARIGARPKVIEALKAEGLI
ncbi:glutathione transferase GstA [Pseudomonas mendocina]|jgi:glutathione S-transferase|uniref:glutathione transferase GstA n=1 Tax=Ectopseudomonas mendocina TaxID=300 RepID=UPI00117A344E|nr:MULTISPECIES: glutathione transferase GstA [Pseudomonas]MDF2075399.1 glutathione transferase GstA [Pseudomonas mendocina]TRO39852.1 glutathione transferase GstA [Pseudomonas sp. ALS1131]